MLKGIHPNIKLRIGIGFVQRLLDMMLIPLMIIHFSGLYGAATAGLMTVVAAGVAIACTFLGGYLSDVRGRRRTMLVSEVGCFVAAVCLALANSPWWESGIATYIFYLVNTALISVVRPASDAMIIDVSTPETRPRIYAVNYWATNVAFVVGSLLAGFLYGGHFFLILAAAAVLSGGVAVVTWRWISETRPATGTTAGTTAETAAGTAGGSAAGTADGPGTGRTGWLLPLLRGYAAVLRDRVFARFFLSILLFTCIQVQLANYIGVRLSQEFPPQRLFDVGPWALDVDGVNMFGILRAISTFVVVCLALSATTIFRRLTDGQRIGGGTIVVTAGYMVLAVSNDPGVLITATVVFALGEIMTSPTRQALLADVVHPDARSMYMAVYQLQFRLAAVAGSLCVTLGTFVPPAAMSVLYGVFGAASCLLILSVLRARAAGARAEAAPRPEGDPVETAPDGTGDRAEAVPRADGDRTAAAPHAAGDAGGPHTRHATSGSRR
ncbi:MFS transporter [Streptosporangium sandarakinum]|uniref:DHA1 family multidrug resistance protein B-like MFS transporter n=1 Tax=Streptosporangium sandarakinum TaxID=1260955 RepID=A0A852UT02_9ACTN|nr:MFS transporter [Streptosporangium sandarakinum]NYF38244.1 DHA1 family multidrug resistance protein B-like MFS transporter [Streptosporangium sandarakinum]